MLLCAAGKVHGSLARAGKVRGQTPKVQKQDKKKQPKGRAMKRIKYNRRFVNVGKAPFRDVASCGPAGFVRFLTSAVLVFSPVLSNHSKASMHGSAQGRLVH